MKLSKDSAKLACSLYKTYLEKRKNGQSKASAKHFSNGFYKEIKPLSSWTTEDITETLNELKRANFIKKYIDGSFQIQDNFIIYMENRFKNGVTEVSDFISKFIP